ncbi:hypothetical protein LCGC14_1157770 [marine sediment metagenome]|uniref:Uncharacterized protein n=1 Tax=marine sediment metagenome TaxID=412755 RepID=A0A0F9MGQ3_9ZZZZ
MMVLKLYLLVAVGVAAYLYRTQVSGTERDTVRWLALLLAALTTAAVWPAWVVVDVRMRMKR